MLKVLLDSYAALERQQVTLLNLLYLSWAFDLAVKYHDIVLRVPSLVYVVPHSQQQMLSFLRGSVLRRIVLLFGVPQWSVLEIFFLLYTAELFDVIAECGFTAHSYADETQVTVSTSASGHIVAIERLVRCIVCIRDWMARN